MITALILLLYILWAFYITQAHSQTHSHTLSNNIPVKEVLFPLRSSNRTANEFGK